MKKRGGHRRSLSLGTIVMLTITALVLVGFLALLPKMTGNVDITLNASELAVAIDNSLSQIASSAVSTAAPNAQPTALPPASLATQAPATQAPKLGFSLCLAGRVNMNNNLIKAMTDDSGYRFDMLFDQLGGLLQADLTVATLSDNVISTDKLGDNNIPADALKALKDAGIDALSMGQANVLDSELDGVRATKQSITSAGMTAFGVYASADERAAATMLDVNGVRVALLNFQDELSNNGKKRVSKDDRAFALMSPDEETMAREIAAVKQAGAQVVVVTLCYAKASGSTPNDAQRQLAQALSNAGADVIIGNNIEAVQDVEIFTGNRGDGKYHPTLCAFSMGNLLTYNREKRTSLAGMLVNVSLQYDASNDTVAFDDLSYTPLYNWRGKVDGKTRYRVLQSNAASPDFVDQEQQSVMERCLKIVQELMQGSSLQEK